MESGARIAVDIGGTFTDIVLMHADGRLAESKVSTTPDDPSRAVVEGVAALLAELRLAPSAVAEVLHGTTAEYALERHGVMLGAEGKVDVAATARLRGSARAQAAQ
jgi:N-methylhydantoinase A